MKRRGKSFFILVKPDYCNEVIIYKNTVLKYIKYKSSLYNINELSVILISHRKDSTVPLLNKSKCINVAMIIININKRKKYKSSKGVSKNVIYTKQ